MLVDRFDDKRNEVEAICQIDTEAIKETEERIEESGVKA